MKKIISALALAGILLSGFPVLAQSVFAVTDVNMIVPKNAQGLPAENQREFSVTFSRPAKEVSVSVYTYEVLASSYSYQITPSPTQASFSLTIGSLKPSTTYKYVITGKAQDDNTVATKEDFFTTSAFGFFVTGVNIVTPNNGLGQPALSERELYTTFSKPAKDVAIDIYDSLSLGLTTSYTYQVAPTANQTTFALVVGSLKPSKRYNYVITGHSQEDNTLAVKEDFFTTDAFTVQPAVQKTPISGLSFNTLLKSDTAAVYYYANDGKRYVFPDSKTFASWYDGTLNVTIKTVTKEQLASLPLGGLVTMRPGKMVKVISDPKTYVVDVGGLLRWIDSEALARQIGGADWAKKVSDIPVSFYVNYKPSSALRSAAQYTDIAVYGSLININQDKGL